MYNAKIWFVRLGWHVCRAEAQFDHGKYIFDLMPSNVDLILKAQLSKSNAGSSQINLLHQGYYNPMDVTGISRQALHVWTATLMYVMLCACVCMWTAALHLFAANTASLNLPATHGSSQNEIILHHGVGMWKANLQPGSTINHIIFKTSLTICYQNKLILTMERDSQIWMHMQANSVI